jgi:hypothetical protein
MNIVAEDSSESAIELEETQENPEIQLPVEKRSIHTKAVDAEIASLHDKWKRGRLLLQPSFQRQFVWDRARASRLIESALLSVPLPIIYLAEEADAKESVIDGQQRLTSFFSFLDGRFPSGETFKLTGMKVFNELNGKGFSDVNDRIQDQIRYCQIRTITILNDSDSDLRFDIFERLNTGSVPLNDMELRNCIYRGRYNVLLREMAAEPEFMKLLGIKEPDKRMRDVEFVLRFASFYHATYLRYQPPMRRFFNQDMDKHRNLSHAEAAALRAAFKNSVQIIWSMFGDKAFKRFYSGDEKDPNGKWETKRFNAALYDVLMGVFSDKDKNQVYAALDPLREALIDLMANNRELVETITVGTSDQDRVQRRFDLVRSVVTEILRSFRKQPRCFSRELKRELYETNPTCALCGNAVQEIDDSAVDHIEQYWKGGQTIPENARLAHRFCNQARPRND